MLLTTQQFNLLLTILLLPRKVFIRGKIRIWFALPVSFPYSGSSWTSPWESARRYRFSLVVQRFKGFRFKALQACLPALL
jgi:hypothetical protein